MPDKMSQEKIDSLRAFGARVVVCPTAVEPEDPRSYYSVSKRLAEETPNCFFANRINNPANPEGTPFTVPRWSSAARSWRFCTGMGPGGTVSDR